jgi:hypothetical protein
MVPTPVTPPKDLISEKSTNAMLYKNFDFQMAW